MAYPSLTLASHSSSSTPASLFLWSAQFQMMSIKLISEQLLLGGPRAGNLNKLDLFIPGELPRQRLTFSRRIVVFASPNNPGALRVAEDLALAMGNCIEVTIDETNAMITHFLLYLNDQTYSEPTGPKLAEELRRAMVVSESGKSAIEIVTVHENDQERGGCEFGIFFDGRTPKDLVNGGIYNVSAQCTFRCHLHCPLSQGMQALPSHTTCTTVTQAIAQALFSGRFWPVSAALVAKAMGATITTGSRSPSLTTESALRAELQCSSLRKRVIRARNRATLADPSRLLKKKASDLYGWDSDGAHATRDRPGREFLRGPGSVSSQSRTNTTSNTTSSAESFRSERTGSSETIGIEDPGPSAGEDTVHGPELLVATGPMQRRPVQARVWYPVSLPSPRWTSVVRV